MGALRAIAAAFALIAAVLSFTAQGRDYEGRGAERWRGLAVEAADRFGLPVEWVMRVIEAESAGRTTLGGQPITSHAGAMGLMQIMPATWASLRAQYELGSDPHDPRDNIVAGTAYLRAMYDRFGYPGLFGAYNAGPGRYGEYLSAGRPLPRETRDYMAKIAGTSPSRPDRRRTPQAAVSAIRAAGDDPIFLTRRANMDASLPSGTPVDRQRSTAPRAAGMGDVTSGSDLFAVRRDGSGRGQ